MMARKPPVDVVWSATQEREVESLMRELSTVARVWREDRVIRYQTRQMGLFSDRVLPPELEVMRVLRTLAEAHRLIVLRETRRGLSVHVQLRTGLALEIAYTPEKPLPPVPRRS
jgi:hypothetical protein